MISKAKPRDYVFSTRDRCDFTIDRIRAVRSKEFKYIRNFMVDRPFAQTTYMDVDGVEFGKVMKQLHADNKLDSIQDRFFKETRPLEELYDLKSYNFELINLTSNPDYAETLEKFHSILLRWMVETDDKGQYQEDVEGLKFMLGICGENATNPEYAHLRLKDENLSGSLSDLKNAGWVN